MPGIARVGDVLGKGGILTFPASPDVFVNGRPVALEGCIYTPHPPCPKDPRHCVGPTFALPAGYKDPVAVLLNGTFLVNSNQNLNGQFSIVGTDVVIDTSVQLNVGDSIEIETTGRVGSHGRRR